MNNNKMIEVRSQDHKFIYSNPSSTRFRESFVPQHTAYRKAFTNLAKSEHHLSLLSDFKHSKRIFKVFKSRIKPLVQNTTLEFTIKWEETIDNLGRMLFSTLVNHRPLQAQENRLFFQISKYLGYIEIIKVVSYGKIYR